jgi:hypothetical protein
MAIPAINASGLEGNKGTGSRMHGVLALLDSVTLWGRITRHPAGDRPSWTALATKCRSSFSNIVPGAFTPALAKRSKSVPLIDCISVGVDRMQRNFELMKKQVEAWQRSELRCHSEGGHLRSLCRGQAGGSEASSVSHRHSRHSMRSRNSKPPRS